MAQLFPKPNYNFSHVIRWDDSPDGPPDGVNYLVADKAGYVTVLGPKTFRGIGDGYRIGKAIQVLKADVVFCYKPKLSIGSEIAIRRSYDFKISFFWTSRPQDGAGFEFPVTDLFERKGGGVTNCCSELFRNSQYDCFYDYLGEINVVVDERRNAGGIDYSTTYSCTPGTSQALSLDINRVQRCVEDSDLDKFDQVYDGQLCCYWHCDDVNYHLIDNFWMDVKFYFKYL